MDGMNFLFWYHNRSKNDTLDISYLPVYVWLLKRYINELNFVTSTNEDILITVTCQKKTIIYELHFSEATYEDI